MSERADRPERNKPAIESARPDYDKWAEKDGWSAHDSASLLVDIEPPAESAPRRGESSTQFEQVKLLIEKHAGKSLKWLHTTTVNPRFAPYVLLQWAEEQFLSVPPPLKAAVIRSWPSQFRTGEFLTAIDTLKSEIQRLKAELNDKRKESTPSYLRPDHPHFSAELSAAVNVWIALFQSGEFDTKHAAKKQLESWLGSHGEEVSGKGRKLSEAAIRRIAIVANPLKSGGAPRSQ